MILLILPVVGLILSIILLYFNARKFPAFIFLGALCFLVCLYSFIQWVLYYSKSPTLVGIFYLNFAFLAYLIGPLNYWYIRSVLKDEYRLKKNDLWHIVPALIVLATSIPYLLTSGSVKTRVASEIINDLKYLMISPFIFPEILYGLPRLPNNYLENRIAADNHQNEFNKSHIAPLEDDYLSLIGQKADQFMKDRQLYLQRDFNLVELSVVMHIPVHHLAYYFREERKQSFTNYRNSWRIDYAKNLINEGKAKDLTLEAIGMLSGFTNRNSFIIAFKRFEKISPHEYLADDIVNDD